VTLLALALQNLRRKPARAAVLAGAAAIAIGAVFASGTLLLGVDQSLAAGLSRLGADLLVVPGDVLVNIHGALLIGEPSPSRMSGRILDEVRALPGVKQATPQLILVGVHVCCGLAEPVVVGFDPATDFTVVPWLGEKLDRPMGRDDVIVGGLLRPQPGEAITVEGQRLMVYGRLGRTGVGSFDRAIFVDIQRAYALEERTGYGHGHRGGHRHGGVDLPAPGTISAVLVALEVGAKAEAVRFAMSPEAKVVTGGAALTATRQSLVAMLRGGLLLSALLLVVTVVMIGAVFSAVVNERRRELGVLRAIGARKQTLFGLILSEALVVTLAGGILGVGLGVGLLRLFARTVGFALASVDVALHWPPLGMLQVSLGCLGCALAVGALGALFPALRASRAEPYELIRAGE
jgi:putative ABC transport system permease protein